ncbi:universal stress protein [Desulfopila sp. IMCC35008]|uniref:universal stress protein n=1 Tax=Desulfopila sp. IMCC35008 TaxID=2653858 RepID=UPI0013D50999|nr:universal stress protein [Desulfopila sp. IMCC35008]
MKRFKNILYVIDGEISEEDHVSKKVESLARLNNATVKIVRILDGSYFNSFARKFFDPKDSYEQIIREQLESETSAFTEHNRWQGIPVTSEVLQGKGFISIIQHVMRHDNDLVVKQNLRMAGTGTDNLAMRLLRKCPCPIWLIQPHSSAEYQRVLAAVDVTTDQEESDHLNRKIIELCHSMAQREKGEAHYLHAWYLRAESMLTSPRLKVSVDEIQKIKDGIQKDSEEEFSKLFEDAQITPLPEHVHVQEGDTAEVIKRAIERLEIDVLILGTIGRTGIPGLLIGNTAESIISDISCSLLAVKPDGFVSPVTL